MPGLNWVDVARAVAPLAPTLGGLIGGLVPFPGAGAAGQLIGAMIAREFGVPATADAVAGAVQSNPNEVVLAKLRAVTAQLQAKYASDASIARARAEVDRAYLAALGASVQQVNETMRATVGHEHWFYSGWRPVAGWLFDINAAVFGALLAVATLMSLLGNPAPLAAAQAAWPLYASFLGGLALMVGVYAYGRSQEKVGGAPQPLQVGVDTLVAGSRALLAHPAPEPAPKVPAVPKTVVDTSMPASDDTSGASNPEDR